jgi:hypothetical protein
MSDFKGSLKGTPKSENPPNRLICFVILAGYMSSSYTTFHQSFQTKKGPKYPKQASFLPLEVIFDKQELLVKNQRIPTDYFLNLTI